MNCPLLDLFRGQRVNAARPGFAFDRNEVDLDQFRTVDPRSRLLATACFTCFIRLRSGIANSHQNKPSPTADTDTEAITMQLWQPNGRSAFTRR
jgi:hypothetical protein